jgi:hypothetical protein
MRSRQGISKEWNSSTQPLTRHLGVAPPAPSLQVWNMNRCGGVVGLFNVQGATWRTTIRNYHQHDPSPRALTARVSPADVPRLPAAERYVAYSDALQVGVPALFRMLLFGCSIIFVGVGWGGSRLVLSLAPDGQCLCAQCMLYVPPSVFAIATSLCQAGFTCQVDF